VAPNAFEETERRRYVRIANPEGLHLQAAAALSQAARKCECNIRITCNEQIADAKSILELLCLRASTGSEVTIEAFGPGSAYAVKRITDLIHSGFEMTSSPGA
jgi:phosphotransferase system HPr (HPr) family protein